MGAISIIQVSESIAAMSMIPSAWMCFGVGSLDAFPKI